jgi:1-acyl-sn-glycerol-3-phosphate acyltransferase
MTKAPGRRGGVLWRAYEYLAMGLGLGFLALLCLTWLPGALLCAWLPRRIGRRIGRLAIMIGFRVYLYFLQAFCACRFDLSALDRLRGEGPMVIIANHPSLLDVVMIVSRLPNATCVMKASLMDNVLLGAAARVARYIRNDAPLGMVRRARSELAAGAQLVIFPEGSRTRGFPLDPFAGAAALIAASAGVPVQAVFIDFTSPYLGKAWPLFRKPELPLSFAIRLGRRFAPPAQVRSFTRDAEAYYRAEFAGQARPGSAASDQEQAPA